MTLRDMSGLQIIIKNSENVLVDHYKQPFGIRELVYDNTSFTINGKNIYIRGEEVYAELAKQFNVFFL